MAADIQEDWLAILPRQLQPDAIALVRYLKGIPAMKPVGSPWCGSLNITGYPSGPRMYHCRGCDRRFTALTGKLSAPGTMGALCPRQVVRAPATSGRAINGIVARCL